MVASTCFHLLMPLGKEYYHQLLRVDLIGIGIMIFGLTICTAYAAMH